MSQLCRGNEKHQRTPERCTIIQDVQRWLIVSLSFPHIAIGHDYAWPLDASFVSSVIVMHRGNSSIACAFLNSHPTLPALPIAFTVLDGGPSTQEWEATARKFPSMMNLRHVFSIVVSWESLPRTTFEIFSTMVVSHRDHFKPHFVCGLQFFRSENDGRNIALSVFLALTTMVYEIRLLHFVKCLSTLENVGGPSLHLKDAAVYDVTQNSVVRNVSFVHFVEKQRLTGTMCRSSG